MNFYETLDEARRWQGRVLDMWGYGPVETPSRVLFSTPALTLRAYGESDRQGPAVLIVPAPIKRPYIFDLIPSVSVVQQFLRHGCSVYVIHWERPSTEEQRYGLAAYADQFILRCVDAIHAQAGRRGVVLTGHSLGGTLSAIFAALHPERVERLVMLGAPVQFGKDAGAFAPLVESAPPAQLVTALFGSVPGSFLNSVSVAASPETFVGERLLDRFKSFADPEAMQTHVRVERWTLDEQPLPRRLFEDVVELLYRDNRFMKGTLKIAGKPAAPDRVRAPLLSVVDRKSRIVPPESVLPFHDAAGSSDKRVLWYDGDVGVYLQHVGMLVGKSAHQSLWPEILRWVNTSGETP